MSMCQTSLTQIIAGVRFSFPSSQPAKDTLAYIFRNVETVPALKYKTAFKDLNRHKPNSPKWQWVKKIYTQTGTPSKWKLGLPPVHILVTHFDPKSLHPACLGAVEQDAESSLVAETWKLGSWDALRGLGFGSALPSVSDGT